MSGMGRGQEVMETSSRKSQAHQQRGSEQCGHCSDTGTVMEEGIVNVSIHSGTTTCGHTKGGDGAGC